MCLLCKCSWISYKTLFLSTISITTWWWQQQPQHLLQRQHRKITSFSASCPITPHNCTWSKQARRRAVRWHHQMAAQGAVAACGTAMGTAVCPAHGRTQLPQSYTAPSLTSSHSTEHTGTATQRLATWVLCTIYGRQEKPGGLQEDLEMNREVWK